MLGASARGEKSSTGRRDENELRWVECPRDAWQGLPKQIPTERKRAYLQALLDAGMHNLDLGSFVSPRAVPQMADTEAVLQGLERPDGTDFLCIVANARGLERAVTCPGVTSVGYPLSVNETFQLRNSGMDLHESWRLIQELRLDAQAHGLDLVVYLSMGFGNPYGEEWHPADTARAVERLRGMGIDRLVLADTVGTADRTLVEQVLAAVDRCEDLGLHLHSRPDAWQDTLTGAWERGVRWFEGALAGVGGCPFASDELVGNLPSEQVLPFMAGLGATFPMSMAALPPLASWAAELAAQARAPD